MMEDLLLEAQTLGAEVDLGISQTRATLSAKSHVTIRTSLSRGKVKLSHITLAIRQESGYSSDLKLSMQLTSQTSRFQH